MSNLSKRFFMHCIASFVAFGTVLPAHSAEQIVIDGSTGVMPLVRALAVVYREQRPGVAIHMGKGLGTKARIEALREGKIQIAMASHGLDVASIMKQGLAVHEIAKVAVVFGVNAGVSVIRIIGRAGRFDLMSLQLEPA